MLIVGDRRAAIGAAFAMGQLRTTFATAGRLEKATGLPVIGAIGEVVTRVQSDARRQAAEAVRRRRARRWSPPMSLLLGVEILQRGLAA